MKHYWTVDGARPWPSRMALAQQALPTKEPEAGQDGGTGQSRRQGRHAVATVNGVGVPRQRADFMMQQQARAARRTTSRLRAQVREELINREVIARRRSERPGEEARGAGAARHGAPGGHRQRLSSATGSRKNPITDAEIQKEYERAKSQTGDKEYKARHILVETEDAGEEADRAS